MSNMSYCRFRNTQLDLADCAEAINYELSKDEARARINLINLCQQILQDVGYEVNNNGIDLENLPVEDFGPDEDED